MATKTIKPSEIIRNKMAERNMHIVELAAHLQMSRREAMELLEDKREIGLFTAKLLCELFGEAPLYWLNLSNDYRNEREEILEEEEKVKVIIEFGDLDTQESSEILGLISKRREVISALHTIQSIIHDYSVHKRRGYGVIPLVPVYHKDGEGNDTWELKEYRDYDYDNEEDRKKAKDVVDLEPLLDELRDAISEVVHLAEW